MISDQYSVIDKNRLGSSISLTYTLLFLAILLQSCVIQAIYPTPTPTPFPTPSPSPVAIVSIDPHEVALIDADGLDFVEKRIIDVYNRVSPSVVNVTTQVLRPSFFFDIIPEEGAGSGFILDIAGHVLTNYHVIEGAQQIEVTFADETTFSATLIGADPRNDIAILKVDAPSTLLVPVELGQSANLQVGQRAIAIGNPFGQFGGTLTIGIISALDRSLESPDGRLIPGIIQTDAAINRGNSGGPLLDSVGRVIGINTAIFSPSGTNSGVGFAVPVDTIRRILPDLITLGHYPHPWLGIRFAYRLTPDLAKILDIPVDQGLLLVEFYRNSPLALSSLREARQEVWLDNERIYIGGDVLVAVNGKPITSLNDVQTLLETYYRIGDEVVLVVVREGVEMEVKVRLAEEPLR